MFILHWKPAVRHVANSCCKALRGPHCKRWTSQASILLQLHLKWLYGVHGLYSHRSAVSCSSVPLTFCICRERIWAFISSFFAFFTMLFCILLTIFDAFNHSSLHWPFAATFFICLVLSGIANLVEIACKALDTLVPA